MKTKTLLLLFAALALGFFVLGASGAVTFAEEAESPALREEDRLVGVLVTWEYLDLFDIEGYLNDHGKELLRGGELDEASTAAYQGRLYAQLETDEGGRARYCFPVEGIAYFCAHYTDESGSYWSGGGDEAISDGHTHLRCTDEGDSVELSGTIYVANGRAHFPSFFFNPIYQSGDGQLYALAGNGASFDMEAPGGSFTHHLKEESRMESGEAVEADSGSVEITVTFVPEPESVEILEMDGEHGLLSRLSCDPGDLPGELEPQPDTAYILLEATDAEGAVTRTIYQRGDETLTALRCREDGVCVQQDCALRWSEE